MKYKVGLITAVFFGFAPTEAEAKLSVSTGHTAYITPAELKNQRDHYTDLYLNFQKYGHFKPWFYGSEIKSRFSLDNSYQNHFTVPDLFMGYNGGFNHWQFNLILGRHKRVSAPAHLANPDQSSDSSIYVVEEPWSAMDEIWQLGLWQGRVNWDYFQAQQQGLTGAFFTIEKKPWLFSLFLSPLFVPENGPSVEIKEGEVRSSSRWFLPPQSQFISFSQRIDALYWLHKPYLKDIILNESIAVKFRFGDKTKQWFSMAYGYKPINQVYFKIDSAFSIDKKAIDNVLNYQPFRHSLISMDFGLKRGAFKTILSVTQEIPNRPKSPGKGLLPFLPNGLFFSAHTALNFKEYKWLLESLKINFIYSHFSSKKTAVSEPQLNIDLNINRFKMHYGLALSAQSKPFEWKNQSLALALNYWYSIPEQGGWLNASLNWKITTTLSFQSSIDILGVENLKQNSFFNSYKQNDRINATVTYVFD